MAHRPVRRTARFLLLLAALLGLAFLLGCWRLPAFLERRAIASMSEYGLDEAEVRVTTVGFSAINFANFRAITDTWTIEFESGYADYRPQDLLNGRVDSVALDGLRLEWKPPVDAKTPSPASPGHTPLTGDLVTHLPFQHLTLSNATLILRGEGQQRTLPFTAQLAANQGAGSFAGRWLTDGPEDRIEVMGRFATQGESRLSAKFYLGDPAAWLSLWGGMPLPHALDPIQWDPWAGTLEFHLPPGATESLVTASIQPLRALWNGNRLTTAGLTGEARGQPFAPSQLLLNSGLDWTSPSGLHLSAPHLTLELADFTRLETRARELDLQHPGILRTKGSVLLVVDELRKGAQAAFELRFQLDETELLGFSIEPFQAEVIGDHTRVGIAIPELTALIQGRWRLSRVEGQLVNPLGTDATVNLSGFLDGARPATLQTIKPLPFELRAQRRPEGVAASMGLSMHGLVIPALSAQDTAHLDGSMELTAEVDDIQSQVRAQLGLEMPDAHLAGVWVRHAAVSGEITLRTTVTPTPSLPRWLLTLLQSWPLPTLDTLDCSTIDLRLDASAVRSQTGLVLTEPFLKLRRHAAEPLGEASPLGFELGLARLEWNGMELVDLTGSGFIDEHGAYLDGSVLWMGETLSFHIRLVPETNHSAEPRLVGRFTVGPWRAVDALLPKQITAGEDVTIEGQAILEGQLSFGTHSPLEWLARLELGLASLDWPGRSLSLEHARALVVVSGPEPWQAHTPEGFQVARLHLAGQELHEIEGHVELNSKNGARFAETSARWLGGQIRIVPFAWDWGTEDLDVELQIQGLDLQALSHQLPRFTGTLEGQVHGRIPMVRKAGRWQISQGRLELNQQFPARLMVAAEGLLTGSLRPGSSRYQQLKLVEEGLKDLRLQELTLDLNTTPGPEPVVRIRLEGLSLSPYATVPIILNLNLHGAVDEVRRLIEKGALELSW